MMISFEFTFYKSNSLPLPRMPMSSLLNLAIYEVLMSECWVYE